MPSPVELASIASSLDTYRTQFAALGHALSALRTVSDEMIAQLDRDREALASHIEAALDMISEAGTSGTGASDVAKLDTSDVEADLAGSEIQDIAALDTELAADEATEAVADHVIDSEPVAGETPADPIVELAPSEASISIATDATALVATEPGVADQASNEAQADAAPATLEETSGEVTSVGAKSGEAKSGEAKSGEAKSGEAKSGEAKSGDENLGHDKPGEGKVVSLAERRKATPVASPARRRAMAVVASIFVTATATLGLHELMQTELGQRMLELGTCDGDMVSATRDCGLLAWLLI